MNAPVLSAATKKDIDKRVARVLADLGNPDPPLSLDAVRELLRLDLQFYASGDNSKLDTLVHYIRVGAKRTFEKPSRLLDAIRKLDLRAVLIPEQKVIFLDQRRAAIKRRWDESHEVGHKILEWHDDLLFGDTEFTLSRECHELIEAEANFAAGRLLFLQDRFVREITDLPFSIATAEVLRKRYQNSKTTTLWRMVDLTDRPAFLIISKHPGFTDPDSSDVLSAIRHFNRSPIFAREYGQGAQNLFKVVCEQSSTARGGPLCDFEFVLENTRGESSLFHVETFFNSYDALTLGYFVRPHGLVVAI